MAPLVPRLELPNELLFKILAQVLAHSVHMVIVSSGDIEWHLHAHHTLSAVCFSFREIMKGISSKAFQFAATEASPNLAHHVQRQLQSLRSLGAAIRDPAVPGSFSIESLDSSAPQLVQGYSLYIAIVYLRTQASRSTPEIYQSTSATIFGAVITLSKVLYSRIVPREVAVMLKHATEDEAELSHIGVLVVKHCGLLSGFADALAVEHDPQDEVASLRRDINKIKTEQMISIIDSADVEFLSLFRRNEPLPCCTAIWISQLPDVYSTLERVYGIFTKQPSLISEGAITRLRSLVERWAPTPPPAEAPNTDDDDSQLAP
ncbi:Peptide hydrolase [Mycena venus]|uniref:Peptide hydrolase n=1 Tax=Mycena venus TaxID=2733690 RepID=A0A8H7CP60_9AGAR|nr:Peptide hydrolase [Mycena venus]